MLATAPTLLGELVGAGCATIEGKALSAPGSVELLLPLRPVVYDIAGTYNLVTALRVPADDPAIEAAYESGSDEHIAAVIELMDQRHANQQAVTGQFMAAGRT